MCPDPHTRLTKSPGVIDGELFGGSSASGSRNQPVDLLDLGVDNPV